MEISKYGTIDPFTKTRIGQHLFQTAGYWIMDVYHMLELPDNIKIPQILKYYLSLLVDNAEFIWAVDAFSDK